MTSKHPDSRLEGSGRPWSRGGAGTGAGQAPGRASHSPAPVHLPEAIGGRCRLTDVIT